MSNRLPDPGGDEDTWGEILNDFLDVEHNADGTLKIRTDGTIPTKLAQLTGDVNIATPANGQVLSYSSSGSQWVPATVSSTTVNDATTSAPGLVQLAGDFNGTATDPTVISTHLSSALPVAQGGTGSTTQNFVDLSSGQSIGGVKTFTSAPVVPSSSFPESAVTNLTSDLGLKAPLTSPALTGVPTAPTATSGTNTTQIATTSFVESAVTSGAAPAATFTTSGIVKQTVYNVRDYGATGNGSTDDTSSINNAIAAAAGNGQVYFPAGTYLVSSTLSLPTGTQLVGAGRDEAELYLANGVDNYFISVSNVTDVEISFLKINGNYTNQGSEANWINVVQATRFKMHDCWITNSASFRGNAMSYCEIYANYFDNASTLTDAITLGSTLGGGVYSGSIGNRVFNNTITSYAIGVNLFDNFSSNGSYANEIFGNDIFPGAGGDIILVGGPACHDNIVNGNYINSSGEDGIRVSSNAYNIVVSNNRVNNAARYGIVLANVNTGCTITGNVVTNSGSQNYFIDDESSANTFSGNQSISSVQSGFYINATAFGNVFTNNVIVSSGQYGIYDASSGGNNQYISNRIDGGGVTSNGIYILNSQNNVINGNISKNNTASGLRIESSSSSTPTQYNTVIGNRIFDDQSSPTQTYGIQETGSNSPNYNTYIGNDVENNKTTNMTFVGANDVSFANLGASSEQNAYLPISGGTMSGNINFNGLNNYIISQGASASGNGKTLAINSGSAASGASNASAGALYIQTGLSNGTGIAEIIFQAAPPGLSGSTQNSSRTAVATMNSTGLYLGGGSGASSLLQLADGGNIQFGTTTGTTIGTSSTQKIGFFNTTPVVQPSGDVLTALSSLGLVASPSISTSDIPTLNQNTTGTAANVTGVVGVANGGTNANSASIAAFNNITGYSASGATGTTSTHLVFSTSPSLVTPVLGSATGTGLILTGSSVNILTAGQNGSTNAAFNVDASTASGATGLNIKSAAAGSGLAISTISSGTNENLTIDAKGSGTVTINGTTATGIVALPAGSTIGGSPALTANITSSSANAFAVGPNGTTNPSFNIDASTASAATGVNIKSAAAGSGVALGVVSSGTNETLLIAGKGSGQLKFQSGATGDIIMYNRVGLLSQTYIASPLVTHSPTAVNATATLTGAQAITGYIKSTSAAATNITLPTATAVASAMNLYNGGQGQILDIFFDNTAGASLVTVIPGSGMTASDLAAASPTTFGLLTFSATAAGQGCIRLTFSSSTACTYTRVS